MWRVRKGRWLSLLQYMTMVISLIPIFTIYSAHVYSITVEGAWLKWKLAPLHHWSTLTEKFEKGERPGNKVIYLASSPRHMLALLAFFFFRLCNDKFGEILHVTRLQQLYSAWNTGGINHEWNLSSLGLE